MMDQNRPAKLLDTAYNALKSNPAATNQIMQAAAQGAPVGLKGLAAAAAQQSQQQAQHAMAALQQRGPQPNVIQQLAHAGIMSQMDTGLPGAPVQEEIPQMMAGGGLVAFADGGNVLPPDVIEAIQSHFAEGGDVRGFAGGGGSYAELYDSYLKRLPSFSSLSKEEAQAEGKALTEMLKKKYAAENIVEGLTKSAGSVRPKYEELYALAEENAREPTKISRSYSGLYPQADVGKAGYSPYRAPNPSASEYIYLNQDADYPGKERALERIGNTRGLSSEAQSFVEARGKTLPPLDMPTETPRGPSMRERFNLSAGSLGKPIGESISDVGSSVTPYAKSIGKKLLGTAGLLGTGYETYQTAKDLKDIYADEDLGAQEKAEKMLRAGLRSGMGGVGSAIGGAYGGLSGGMAGGAGLAGLSDLIMNYGEKLAGVTPESMREAKYQDVNRAITLDELKARRKGEWETPEAGTSKYPYEEEEVEEGGEPILQDRSAKKPVTAPKTKPATWKPEDHDGHPVTPRVMVPEEGQKLDKTFDEAKKNVPSAAATPGIAGLGAGVDMEKMRDLIIGLGGHKEMTPEVKAKLDDLESSARTSTILQSFLGGLGGGLSSPYGGRFALGKAALGALSGYQHGIGSEEDIGRKAFDVLRGYADAPEEEKTKARDLLFGQLGKAAELQSARDIAEAKGGDALERLLLSERGKYERYGLGLGQKGEATEANIISARNSAYTQARELLKDKIPAASQSEITALAGVIYQNLTKDLPSLQGTGLGGGTLGGGQLGSRPPIIQ